MTKLSACMCKLHTMSVCYARRKHLTARMRVNFVPATIWGEDKRDAHLCCRTWALAKAVVPHEEGLVLKNPESEWKPDDRRLGSWVKLKPEYVRRYQVSSLLQHHPALLRHSRCIDCNVVWVLV